MFFEFTDITAHPVDKNTGQYIRTEGNSFFQSARAVGEVNRGVLRTILKRLRRFHC